MIPAAGEPIDTVVLPRGIARDAGTVTLWNLLSRATGFARVLVVGGALGATRLGDTYQSSNQVSNLLFELLAAGTLSAVLVPGLTTRLVGEDRAGAESFAGALLARALVVLGIVAAVGMLAARPIMSVLLSGNDSASRNAQVRLGALLLLFVMPQLLFYAWGAVLTATLNADGRFAAAAAAPVANNVVVIAALGVFWARGAQGLALGTADELLLGAAALGGVVCMTLVPAVAAARRGLRVRPHWATSEPMARMLRDAGWATLVVVPAQVFLFTTLVVAGRVPGGVLACQVALTFFLLPHALLGHPLATVLYPRMARAWVGGDASSLRRDAGGGLRALALVTAPAAALLVALAPWLLPAVSVGALARNSGPELVAAALVGYGFGLMAYSWSLLLSRVSYATGDVRTPALAALAGGAVGVAMLGVATSTDGTSLLYRVGLAHTAMVTVAAAATLVLLARRGLVAAAIGASARVAGAAIVAGVCARVVADQLGVPHSRAEAALTVVIAAVIALAVYGAAVALAGVGVRQLRADLS